MITENLLDSTFGHISADWESAKSEAREILARVAKAESTISYGDLARGIRSIRFDPHGDDFRHFLGQLSWEADAAGTGMITVLVVHAGGDNRPGNGFFKLAKHLGRDVSDPDICWITELQRVYREDAGPATRSR
jgi:hypothetical protein